jgi:hypothetical protein
VHALHFIYGDRSMNKRIAFLCLLASLLLFTPARSTAAPHDDDDMRHKIKHVFVIVLENEGFDVTFGPKSKAPYLSKTLTSQGVLLNQYYGTGHVSLDNYVAMISGQAATPQTRNDCQVYQDSPSPASLPTAKPSAPAASIPLPSRRSSTNSTPWAKPGAATWATWATIRRANPPPAAIPR